MLNQETRSLAADNEVMAAQDLQNQMAQSTRNKKDDLNDFKSDGEPTYESGVEIEING